MMEKKKTMLIVENILKAESKRKHNEPPFIRDMGLTSCQLFDLEPKKIFIR